MFRRSISFFALFLLMVSSVGLRANAQRLLPNQNTLEALGGLAIQSGVKNPFSSGDFTTDVGYTHYFKVANYLTVAACYGQSHYTYNDIVKVAHKVPIQDVFLQVSYNHPLLKSRGRDLLLYAGAGVLGGYEFVNKGESVLPNGATLQNGSRWIYGGALMGSMEVFLSDWLVLVVRGQGRFMLNQQTYLFHPTIQAGFRINI